MIKYLFYLSSMFVPTALSAQTLLFSDFDNVIPESYTCIDNDGLYPSANMQKKGFETGKAWIATDSGDGGKAACSTSYYSPKGTADDWLITPTIRVDIGNAELRWRAKANNSKFRDGYKVMVSEGGNSIQDFTTLLFSVDAEENAWQNHAVSLAQYAGKEIRIAFVNNSYNKECLLVDDIYVGVANPVLCTLDIPAVTPIGGAFPLNAVITNHSGEPVDDMVVDIDFGGQSTTCRINTHVSTGETQKCALPDTVWLPAHERMDYGVRAEAAGKVFEYAGSVMSYPRKVVAEEGTATSCSWCIRGVVMMDRMEAKYPDRFISMTAHMNDIMSVDGYIDNLNGINDNILMISIPNAVVNRKVMCDPAYIDVNFRNMFNEEKVMVAMRAEATYDGQTGTIDITSRLWFAEPQKESNYRMAYYIVEDSIYHPGNAEYMQANAYSGSAEDWDGYEKKGTIITDMRFRNVVRGYNGMFDGVEGSIPTSFEADEEITHSCTIAVPDKAENIRKCHVVAMLIDMTDRHIVNACTAPLAVSSEVETITCQDGDSNYEVFLPDGRRVAQGRCLEPLLADRKGMFLVKKGRSVRKIRL